MAELKFIVTMDTSQFTEGANKVMADVKQITSSVEKEGGKIQNQFDGIGKSIGGSMSKYLAMFGGAAALKGLLTEMVNVRSEFQKTDVAIRTMLGSKEKADELMNEVREYAKISPLEFGDITKATQMMISFNIEATKVPQFIKAIGDVSMGEKDRFNSLALAFSQMSATGKLMGQDLLQMINAGFNPLATISDKTGKSIAQLKDEMSKGAISAKMVQDAFIDATSAGGKFYGMSENAAKTIGGQLSMLSDAVAAAFNEVGTKSEGIITTAISGVTKLVENYEAIAKAIGILIATYGTYKAALITMMAIEQAHGVAAAAAAVKTELLAKKQAVLNAVMNANPYAIAAAALATLVGAIVSAATATDAFDDAAESLSEAQASIEAATSAEMSKLDALNKKLIEAGEGTDEYKRIKQQIIDQYSQYYAGLETEWSKVGNLVLMYDKLTLAIRKSIAARQMKSIVDKQLDATDKIVQDKLDKAYKKLIEKYGNERGTELYKKFFEFATLGNGKGLNAKDWKDLEDATMWTTRWGKNATDGIVDFRVSVKELAYDIQKANKASRQFVENLKDLYDVEEEAPEPTTPTVITPTYDPKAAASAKKAAEKAAKERERQAKEQAKERERLAQIYAQQLTEEGRRNADIEFETRDLENKALKDGTEKTIQEIELSHDKELAAITRWYEDIRQKRIDEAKKVFDAQKANEGKNFFESEEYTKAASQDAYTQQEQDALKRRLDAANKIYKDSLAEIPKEEQSAMRNYLRNYGTYQEQRLALAEEYADKISKATTEGERKSLAKQRDEALSQLDFEQFQKGMDWSVIFGDLNRVATGELKEVRAQLQMFKKDANYYKRNPDQIKVIEEAINRINKELAEKGGLFGGLVDSFREYEAAVKAVAEAEEQLKNAVTDEEKERARLALTTARQNMNAASGTKDKAVDATINKTRKLMGVITELGNTEEVSVAQLGSLISNVSETFGEAAGKIGGIIGSILALLDSIGNQNIDEWVKGIANKLFTAIGQAFNSKYSLLHYVAGDLMGASNDLDEDIPNLINANNDLESAIRANTEALEDSSIADIGSVYKNAVELMNEREKNMRSIMQETGSTYSQGFFGLGGKHSAYSYINDALSSADWARISKVVGKNISGAGGFFSLSSEDMKKVQEQATDLFTKIKNAGEDGYAGVAEYMDEYITYFEEFSNLQSKYFEKLTSVSLDSVVSDFNSALADMDSNASDFADKFEDYMRKAIINALVTNQFKPMIEQWYKNFAKAVETEGIDKNEQEALRKEWDAITEQGLKMRDQLRDQFDWGSTGEGSGAYKAASSFSQEQGDELNGRLTAIQIGQAYQNEQLTLAVMTLQSMSVVGQEQGSTLAEMRNLMLIGNGHLEDIARYTRIASQYGTAIEQIAEKIKTL